MPRRTISYPCSLSEPSPGRLERSPNRRDEGRDERAQEYGIGNRILPDRHADKPLGGEIEAGYGIGNRHLPDAKVPVHDNCMNSISFSEPLPK